MGIGHRFQIISRTNDKDILYDSINGINKSFTTVQTAKTNAQSYMKYYNISEEWYKIRITSFNEQHLFPNSLEDELNLLEQTKVDLDDNYYPDRDF